MVDTRTLRVPLRYLIAKPLAPADLPGHVIQRARPVHGCYPATIVPVVACGYFQVQLDAVFPPARWYWLATDDELATLAALHQRLTSIDRALARCWAEQPTLATVNAHPQPDADFGPGKPPPGIVVQQINGFAQPVALYQVVGNVATIQHPARYNDATATQDVAADQLTVLTPQVLAAIGGLVAERFACIHEIHRWWERPSFDAILADLRGVAGGTRRRAPVASV